MQRQALAGLLWSKQFYHYSVPSSGSTATRPARRRRRSAQPGRNCELAACLQRSTCSAMPDKWEYPWFAAWDTGLPLHRHWRRIDPEFAKRSSCCSRANGTCTRTASSRPTSGISPTSIRRSTPGPPGAFTRSPASRPAARRPRLLEEVFHKLLLNFTWWVNRKDPEGRNTSRAASSAWTTSAYSTAAGPTGRRTAARAGRRHGLDGDVLPQHAGDRARAGAAHGRPTRRSPPSSSSTSWRSSHAINGIGDQIGMWDPEDQFYYDVVRRAGGPPEHLKVRSFVGLVPLFAVLAIEPGHARTAAAFPATDGVVSSSIVRDLAGNVCLMTQRGEGGRIGSSRWPTVRSWNPYSLGCSIPAQFLSDFGLRSLSQGLRQDTVHLRRQAWSPTSRPSPARRSTAATRTGAGRSGSRSTT